MRSKKTPEEVLQWAADNKLEEDLGGKVGLLKMVLRGLLVAGSKSFTHMLIALERYDDLLTSLLAQTGEKVETCSELDPSNGQDVDSFILSCLDSLPASEVLKMDSMFNVNGRQRSSCCQRHLRISQWYLQCFPA